MSLRGKFLSSPVNQQKLIKEGSSNDGRDFNLFRGYKRPLIDTVISKSSSCDNRKSLSHYNDNNDFSSRNYYGFHTRQNGSQNLNPLGYSNINYPQKDLQQCKNSSINSSTLSFVFMNDEMLKAVPKSNKLCEFVFSNIDWGYRHAPNQRFVRREVKAQARLNKVFEWFDRKTDEEKQQLLRDAVFAAPKLAKDAAEEEKNLQDAIYEKLCEQHAKEVIAAGVKQQNKDKAILDVQHYGGEWTSEEMMNTCLQHLSEAQKKKAFAAQLKFHKFVSLTAPANSTLFTLSIKGKQKTMDQLKRQVHTLIDMKNENDEC